SVSFRNIPLKVAQTSWPPVLSLDQFRLSRISKSSAIQKTACGTLQMARLPGSISESRKHKTKFNLVADCNHSNESISIASSIRIWWKSNVIGLHSDHHRPATSNGCAAGIWQPAQRR